MRDSVLLGHRPLKCSISNPGDRMDYCGGVGWSKWVGGGWGSNKSLWPTTKTHKFPTRYQCPSYWSSSSGSVRNIIVGWNAWLVASGSALWPSLSYFFLLIYTLEIKLSTIGYYYRMTKFHGFWRHSGDLFVQIHELVLLILSFEKTIKFTYFYA